MRQVKDVMTMRTINRDAFVSEVSGIFDREHVGGAPVVDVLGKLVGVISKTDITHFDSIGGNPYVARTWELASRHVVTIAPSDSLDTAARLMLDEQVHRLIVVHQERPVGIVTALDFVKLVVADGVSA